MKARFPGKCLSCSKRIAIGDDIIATQNGRRPGWAHADHGPRSASGATVARTWNRLDDTIGRNAANDYLDDLDARAERDRDNAEYAAGIEDANRERFNRDMFGAEYAAAEEYARDMRGLNGDW